MINTLLGIKKQMTSTYDARSRRVGATVVKVEPNWITQIKSQSGKDGYEAVQLGIGSKKSVKKPQLGLLKKTGIEQKVRFFREVRIKNEELRMKEEDLGKAIKAEDVFSIGDEVKVTGTSKGRGFQGGVRRHGFAGGPKTHGQSDRHRAPGSIGSGTTPGRVLKGKRMAGHMGVETVTVRGLEVVGLDKKENLLIIKGGLPGATGSLLKIEKLGRIKGYTPPPEEKESADAEAMADKEEEVASSKNQELSDEKPAEKEGEDNA